MLRPSNRSWQPKKSIRLPPSPQSYFRFMASLRITRNKGTWCANPKKHLGHSQMPANAGFTIAIAMFFHQPIVYPVRCMSLLLRFIPVRLQPAIDYHTALIKRRELLMLPLAVPPWLTTDGLFDRVS